MTPDNRHKHMIVRADISSPPIGELGKSFVTNWIKNLIDRIGMKILHGPVAIYCQVEGNRGMTAFTVIETSHIALHTWDECEPAVLQLDVYTCSDLNVDDVLDEIRAFSPTKVEYKYLDRETCLIEVRSNT